MVNLVLGSKLLTKVKAAYQLNSTLENGRLEAKINRKICRCILVKFFFKKFVFQLLSLNFFL